MKAWRSVGIVAFTVISVTATFAAAAPSAPADRGWLRTATKPTPKAAPRSELGLGKWAAAAVLMGLGGFLLWKRRNQAATAPSQVSKMKILAVTRLSAKAQIVAVEIQGRTLLVGSTDTTVTRLGWLEEPEPILEEEAEDEDGFSTKDDRPQARSQGLAAASRPLARAEVAARPAASKAKAAVRTAAPSPGPSRFRELLADAIGIEPRATKGKPPGASAAAVDEIAATTHDRYVGRTESRQNTQKITRSIPRTTALIDVEGQAKGLLARLNRPET